MLHHADDVNVRVKWAEMLITPDAKYLCHGTQTVRYGSGQSHTYLIYIT